MKIRVRNVMMYGVLWTLLCGNADGVSTIPVYRGEVAAIELTDADINPTAVPDDEIIIGGVLDEGTRCFDLFCAGNCELVSEELGLLLTPSEEIPSPVVPNSKGELVFAVPKPMCTAQMPVGCNAWVNINLTNVSCEFNEIRRYLCLGIRNQGEQKYIDVLYMPYDKDASEASKNHASTYVPMEDIDILEFVPLFSSTNLGSTDGYTAATIGAKFELDGITASEKFDFRSVYRINTQFQESMWREVNCDLQKLGDAWVNIGHIGVGPVQDDNGKFIEQLLAIGRNGKLTTSIDGINWREISSDLESITNINTENENESEIWDIGVAYGNKIWCAVSSEGKVARSLDGGNTWSHISTINGISPDGIAFGNGVFMVVESSTGSNKVYTSLNGEEWKQVGAVNGGNLLCYGNGYWLCGDNSGNTFRSEDNGITWTPLGSSNLGGISSNGSWDGGCYAYGYFYAIDEKNHVIARSQEGESWEKVANISDTDRYYYNITVFGNKIYAFSSSGDSCFVGLFNPDKTLKLEKTPAGN